MADIVLKKVKKVYKLSPDEARKAGLEYTESVAVRDFDLEIKDREFVILVGPSGCGKSTVLRMIAGLEEITEGELYIDGKKMNDVPPKGRNVSMVFQNYALFPHMTVYDNIAFALKMHKVPRKEIDRRVREAADMLGIGHCLHRKPKSLSGGQRQRVAIGRAIVCDAQAFLMDEPLSNLDAKLRSEMRREIIRLRETMQSTFVYVTHDQTEAMTLGDRIVIMRAGLIQQAGTPQEVFNHPANMFVAGFIGLPEMNFFPNAVLEKEDDEYYVNLLGQRIRLPEDRQTAAREKELATGRVTVGIRPVHIPIGEGGVEAEVELTEMLGSEMYVHLIAADGSRFTADVPLEDGKLGSYRAGDRLRVTLEAQRMHFFNSESEENLF